MKPPVAKSPARMNLTSQEAPLIFILFLPGKQLQVHSLAFFSQSKLSMLTIKNTSNFKDKNHMTYLVLIPRNCDI